MIAQHIWINFLLLFEMIASAVGDQHSFSVSSSNKTWANTYTTGDSCTSASYADVETFGLPTGYKDSGPLWLSSETVFSAWIYLNGCFTSTINYQSNKKIFTTTENCLKFCGGNFGIADDKCICPRSYTLSQAGCLGWICSTKDRVFCGNSRYNHGYDCVCEYVLKQSSDIQADRIGYNCVAYHSDTLLYAHRCSDRFPSLCWDAGANYPYYFRNPHHWTDAGTYCYRKNRQFYNPYRHGEIRLRHFNPNNSVYWVGAFRINMTSTNVSTELWPLLYCPAVRIHKTSVERVRVSCNAHLPALCLKQQTSPNWQTTLKQQTSPNGQTTQKQPTITNGQTTLNQQTSPNGQTTQKPQTIPHGKTTLKQQTSPNGGTTLIQQTSPKGQTTLKQQTITNGQTTLKQQTISNGQTTLNQQTRPNGQTTQKPQTIPNGKTTLKQQTSPNGRTALRQQTSPKGQTTLKQQTSPKGQTSLKQQTSPSGQITLKQQTSPEEQTTLKQQTSPNGQTTLRQQTSTKGMTTLQQQTSPNDQNWFIPVLISSIIIGVILLVIIFVCVVLKIRRRKQTEKPEISLSEVRNPPLPTQSDGNDGHLGELNRGNSDNDIYNELHEESRRRPNDIDELYDNTPTGNNIYGKLHQRPVTSDESAYDSMAAIRCAEGAYGTTVYRSSVTDEDYGHLTACSPSETHQHIAET